MPYIRVAKYSIEEIFPYFFSQITIERLIKQGYFPKYIMEEHKLKLFNGYRVSLGSHRYKNFCLNGVVCKTCGLSGTFFALERLVNKNYYNRYIKDPEKYLKTEIRLDAKTSKNYNNGSYHFNLYAIDKNGDEVLMTKDHVIPRSKGGPDKVENYQTLCTKCNSKKGNNLNWVYSKPKSQWKKIKYYTPKDKPILVLLEKEIFGSRIHVGMLGANAMIAGQLKKNCPKIIGWQKLPEID